jgi:hypothetical protein
VTKRQGKRLKGKEKRHTLLPLGKAHGEEDHICAETTGDKAQGVRFQALDLSMGFPFPFPLRLWRIGF